MGSRKGKGKMITHRPQLTFDEPDHRAPAAKSAERPRAIFRVNAHIESVRRRANRAFADMRAAWNLRRRLRTNTVLGALRSAHSAAGVYFERSGWRKFHDEQLEEGWADQPGGSAGRSAVDQLLGDCAARRQAADPLRGPATPVRRLRPDQERLRRARLRRKAHQGGDQRDGARARPALRFPRRRSVQGPADLHAGQVRRPGDRGRRRRRLDPRDLADRGNPRLPCRHQGRRPDRQDRRNRHARHAAHQGGRDDARQTRHAGRADHRAQGCRGARSRSR